VRRRSRRLQQGGAEVPRVGDTDLQPARLHNGAGRRGPFCYDGHVSDQLTAAPEVSGDRQALEFGPGGPQRLLGIFEKGRGTMHVKSPSAAFRDCQVLEDLALECRAEALRSPDPVVLGRDLKLAKGSDAQVRVEPQHLVRPQPGHAQELKHAGGDFLAELLQARMGPLPVKFGDDVGDGAADAGDLCQPVLGNKSVKWHNFGLMRSRSLAK